MNDPKKYRAMCVPFESIEAANAALLAFQNELYELRCKHRIRDLSFAIEIDIVNADTEEGESPARVSGHLGSSVKRLELAAYAFGSARTEHEQLLRTIEGMAQAQGKVVK